MRSVFMAPCENCFPLTLMCRKARYSNIHLPVFRIVVVRSCEAGALFYFQE